MYENSKISKGKISLLEYYLPQNGEVEKIFLQSGILGFYVTEEDMKDIILLCNYYLNLEEFEKIES